MEPPQQGFWQIHDYKIDDDGVRRPVFTQTRWDNRVDRRVRQKRVVNYGAFHEVSKPKRGNLDCFPTSASRGTVLPRDKGVRQNRQRKVRHGWIDDPSAHSLGRHEDPRLGFRQIKMGARQPELTDHIRRHMRGIEDGLVGRRQGELMRAGEESEYPTKMDVRREAILSNPYYIPSFLEEATLFTPETFEKMIQGRLVPVDRGATNGDNRRPGDRDAPEAIDDRISQEESRHRLLEAEKAAEYRSYLSYDGIREQVQQPNGQD